MSRAAQYDRTGGPEVVEVREVDESVPGPGQVVLRVHAAGLNPFDTKVRSGFIPMKAPFPRGIGSDVAGTVLAVGPDVTAFAVGDEVAGRAQASVAEQALARASELTRRPAEVPVTQAGSLWVAGLTAFSCTVTVPLGPDDTVLVGGASGAVGLVVVQLARRAGARVVATASEANHQLLRSLGAEPLTYPQLDAFEGQITAVIDCHGREALDAGVRLGVPRERMTAIAAYQALEELGVTGAENASRTAETFAGLLDLIAAGDLVFPVASTYPLADVSAAFTELESRHAPGKIVVIP